MKKWLHKKFKIHFFNIPISMHEKENWRIEGDKHSSRKTRYSISYYTKKKCEFCNKRELIHDKTIETTTGRGTDWM